MSDLVSEDDLARARQDPEVRQRFYADQLDRLLEALNRMRRNTKISAEQARLIKQGVDLAVQLADRLNTKAKNTDTAVA
jgi:imidazolonepropionase-like amidohydrolase